MNVIVGLAAWHWITTQGTTHGETGIFGGRIGRLAIARPSAVVHELGHLFGWRDPAGHTRYLCEEYSRTGYHENIAAGLSCDNDEPPSSGFGEGWNEEDQTCHVLEPKGCIGAPLRPGVGSSGYPLYHCFMGNGQGGFCGHCRQHLWEAFSAWTF
ncbi:MAG: hypothetical protein JXB32_03455 [Deltaproteobacteria bacterium]|nr:hypothetical protein [Deltaproteobacteria bacterium]